MKLPLKPAFLERFCYSWKDKSLFILNLFISEYIDQSLPSKEIISCIETVTKSLYKYKQFSLFLENWQFSDKFSHKFASERLSSQSNKIGNKGGSQKFQFPHSLVNWEKFGNTE